MGYKDAIVKGLSSEPLHVVRSKARSHCLTVKDTTVRFLLKLHGHIRQGELKRLTFKSMKAVEEFINL